jgi:hypothetical protein
MVVGKMDPGTITLYLARKRLSAVETHPDLVAMLRPESVSYPSMTHYHHQAKFATSKPNTICFEPDPGSMIQMKLSYSP